jgi:hypothetical protein
MADLVDALKEASLPIDLQFFATFKSLQQG